MTAELSLTADELAVGDTILHPTFGQVLVVDLIRDGIIAERITVFGRRPGHTLTLYLSPDPARRLQVLRD